MSLSSLASGLSFGSSPKTVVATLCFFRFWLGFGIGGDYPLSATIMAEYANKHTRGSFIAAVFAMQGFGILVGMAEADYVWRIILILGALPAALTYYWRIKMPETARYTALVAKNTEQNLFQKEIFTAVGWLPAAKSMSALDEVFKISFAQFLIAFLGTVPGYWVTVLLIDRVGRFMIQVQGFLFMTVFMFALAIPYHHWLLNKTGFLVMYGLTFFFANFGPNSTTFIVPAEIFPARLRSTCHGISAAAGKAGAIVGAFGFLYAAQNEDKGKTDVGYPAGIGIRNTLFNLGGINLLGLMCTFLVPEAKGRSLEEMSGDIIEDQQETEMV
ncbi:probable inorganic phosphate transporter 1-3 [Phtheirospermum japonicum]|uniref:Probable inorganic phosphate transporter 1-3 n=1 Tax=Phtheirospermum japonicum TaxID=374723 RepID=A0A830B1D7_9LAMI|nr:probable inorganic phosphate transporter 1-3 [Phtheirospermum japonicum]